ncbi:unnamed protein product [Leptidea sinapis]|uniref:Uncharacterized protein n=1 Tax=Leptidea sinapis TaxID=189913 RepID=A0A5E4QU81_9NEOP|nr:unnamed protein product [Leptidea sinapis]
MKAEFRISMEKRRNLNSRHNQPCAAYSTLRECDSGRRTQLAWIQNSITVQKYPVEVVKAAKTTDNPNGPGISTPVPSDTVQQVTL